MSTSAKIDQCAADPSGAAPSKKNNFLNGQIIIFFASDGRQARFNFLQPVPTVAKGEPSPTGGDTGPG